MPADAPSALLGMTLMGTGNDNNTWGTILNNNIQIIENSIAAVTSVSTTGGNTTLTEAQRVNGIIDARGSLASNVVIIVASNLSKHWWFLNNCTLNGFTVSIKITGQTAVTVPAGLNLVYCDGANAMFVG